MAALQITKLPNITTAPHHHNALTTAVPLLRLPRFPQHDNSVTRRDGLFSRSSVKYDASRRFGLVAVRGFDYSAASTATTTTETEEVVVVEEEEKPAEGNGTVTRFRKAAEAEEYPDDVAAFEVRKDGGVWDDILLKLRLMVAPPWQRVQNGSVLVMHLGGEISDLKGKFFSPEFTLPQISENFAKAANDPRVAGIYLKISSLNCGWAKLDEIRRHIVDFRKTGKFVVTYMYRFHEKEYFLGCASDELYAHSLSPFGLYGFALSATFIKGVMEKMGMEPQWVKVGKYKKAGDQISRTTIDKPHLEVLNHMLGERYDYWMDVVSSSTGKRRDDLEKLLNEGAYDMNRLKEAGLLTDVLHEDEVLSRMKAKVGLRKDQVLPMVDYRKYSGVMNWTLGLNSGEDEIAVIRACGCIDMSWSILNFPGTGINPHDVIKQIRAVRESKKYKALVIRIDSAGGDCLASDMIWRELKLVAAEKPVVASLSDIAASGGYYIAMAADAIVTENLSLAVSVGIHQGKLNFSELHKRIGLNKHIVSKGRYAEYPTSGHRALRPEEMQLLDNINKHWYTIFIDRAATSRSMSIEEMEKLAQGRIYHGSHAFALGLVDAVGGMARAIAIAKHKANIQQDKPVRIVELTKPNSGLTEWITGLGTVVAGLGGALGSVSVGPKFGDHGVEARVDVSMLDGLDGGEVSEYSNPIFTIMKSFLKLGLGSI
ncbi:unnamed protein product [Linum tenue]|uniref:Peptidase S49 domain-containing protein n=1 Tax=Linum tenue TaxID=586396 RepID=A0AAV0Q7M7_9ROSI|nr:unnamed protein product [Linum tenue]